MRTVYGGVYPTYHGARILAEEPAVDFVVRGEGEASTLALMEALESNGPGAGNERLERIAGLAFRASGRIFLSENRPPISDLDIWRVGWELIEKWDDYRCFGLGRAAIVQFFARLPHRCTYCGQHGFWTRGAPSVTSVKLADEVEWLYRTHHVNFITLADENPTTLERAWRSFLEEMSKRQLPIHFFATIRATDIVRDRDLLDLYRRAGILYVLMGIESRPVIWCSGSRSGAVRPPVRTFGRVGCSRRTGFSPLLATSWGLRTRHRPRSGQHCGKLRPYDGDYLNAMYVTLHDWTPFGQGSSGPANRSSLDQRKWEPLPLSDIGTEAFTPLATVYLGEMAGELRFHLIATRLWARCFFATGTVCGGTSECGSSGRTLRPCGWPVEVFLSFCCGPHSR